jgi:hypothetical protein
MRAASRTALGSRAVALELDSVDERPGPFLHSKNE